MKEKWTVFKTTMRGRFKRQKQDLHFLNQDGMVACNPRDREAAHRALAEGIAIDNPQAVTCRKCLAAMRRTGSRVSERVRVRER